MLISKGEFQFLLLSWTARAQEEHLFSPLRFIRSFSLPSAHFWHRPQPRICSLMHIVYHVSICIFACCYLFFLTHQSAPFPARWHHLAAEDSPSISSLRAPFLRLRKHPKTALLLRPSLALACSLSLSHSPTFFLILSLHASPSVFLPLPRFPHFSPPHCVRRWQLRSSGALEEQRKQRFGSVALILIFCRLDGRLGGAFIHTPHNHFHCNCRAWLQTRGVVAISTNVPSVTRRLYVFHLKQWLVGEHNVLSRGPRETDVKCKTGRGAKQRLIAMHKSLKETNHNRKMRN